MKLSETDIKNIAEEYKKFGVSLSYLAKKYNVSVPTIRYYCKLNGLIIKTKKYVLFEKKKLIDNFIAEHLKDFVNNDITAKQMAEKFGCAELTMRKHLKRFLNSRTLAEGKVYYRLLHVGDKNGRV